MSGDTDPQLAPQADPLGAMQDLKRSLNRMLWVLIVACVVQAIAVIFMAVKTGTTVGPAATAYPPSGPQLIPAQAWICLTARFWSDSGRGQSGSGCGDGARGAVERFQGRHVQPGESSGHSLAKLGARL